MASHRQDKINDGTAKETAEILRGVKDPRISGNFVSVTGADVSRDLSVAKIYYSVLNDNGEAEKGLESAGGFIRRELSARMNLRVTPKLIFIKDDSTQRAMEISKIIREINEE